MTRGKIISLTNQKGGVGKTTTSINLSASVAKLGKRVLVVDSDPQGNASSGLGVTTRKNLYHLYHCYMDKAGIPKAIQQVDGLKGLDILPTHIDLIGVEVELLNEKQRERFLRNMLTPLLSKYDYIFVDCPPSLGLLTINALTASDSVIIPMQCEYFALEGLSQLVRTIRLIKNSYNHKLKIEGLLLTMYDKRNRLTFQVEKEIKKHFKDKVYTTVIPRNVRLSECPSHGKPALNYDLKSSGAQAYLKFGKEFLKKQRGNKK